MKNIVMILKLTKSKKEQLLLFCSYSGCKFHRGCLRGESQKWTKGLGVFGKTSFSSQEHSKCPVRGSSGQQ